MIYRHILSKSQKTYGQWLQDAHLEVMENLATCVLKTNGKVQQPMKPQAAPRVRQEHKVLFLEQQQKINVCFVLLIQRTVRMVHVQLIFHNPLAHQNGVVLEDGENNVRNNVQEVKGIRVVVMVIVLVLVAHVHVTFL